MKISGKLLRAGLIAGVILAGSNIAFAAATLQDVKTAITVNKDYHQAENLSKEVIANHPNNPDAHYIYAQILEHNGERNAAIHELSEAKRLDPSLHFVKNTEAFHRFEASLGTANSPQTASPALQMRSSPQLTSLAPVNPPPEPPHKSGHTLLWVVLILAVLGVAGYFFYRRMQERDRLEDEERMKALRQDQLKQANSLLESVKPLKLDIRMAKPANPSLLAEVEETERELISLIERLGSAPVAQPEIDKQAKSLEHLRRVFEGKSDPVEMESEPSYMNPQYSSSNQNNQATFVEQPMVATPVYQQVMPQTVYVENGNSGMGGVGSFLSGMAVGAMMGGHEHEREVIHEVREVREIREVPSRNYENDNNDTSNIDFGNDTGDVSDSGGGDIDFDTSDDN